MNLFNNPTSIARSKRMTIAVILFAVTFANVIAQTMSDFNSQLQKEKTNFIELIDTILGYVVIIAFVFMIINFISKTVDQKLSISSFFILLLLKGVFYLFK